MSSFLKADHRELSAFTVDVEDGVSIAMRDVFGINSPQSDRVFTNTQRVLNLLAEYNTYGTFFILGKVAEDFPELVRQIDNAGHEIGVHGYHHLQFHRMTPRSAREELIGAKHLLEDLTGKEIKGHRAPAFSITPKTAWALDVIADCGFTYDSSIVPINGDLLGWPAFPENIINIQTILNRHLIEVPVSTIKILRSSLPFSGGGYLRLFPFFLIKHAFKIHSKSLPTILYMHPYELDSSRYPDYYFHAMRRTSLWKRIRMRSNWLNRKTMALKLKYLLSRYAFTTMSDIIDKAKDNAEIPNYVLELNQNSNNIIRIS